MTDFSELNFLVSLNDRALVLLLIHSHDGKLFRKPNGRVLLRRGPKSYLILLWLMARCEFTSQIYRH